MRKSLVLTLLLLILAVGSFSYIHASVDRSKDAITIDETVLYGDKAFAEGIVINLSTQCNNRLFWDTRYTVGEEPQITTAFTFSQTQLEPKRSRPIFKISLDGMFSSWGAGGSNFDSGAENFPLPVRDVAARTKPGENRTEIVYVKDYYEFYPIAVDFEWPSGFAVNQDTLNLFADFFKIPVHPEHQLAITVEKSAVGNAYQINVSPIQDLLHYSHVASVTTDSHTFFIFSCYTNDGQLLDTSHIPGGYGIYRFPRHSESGVHVLTADELQTAFPIDAQRQRAIALKTSKDKSKLLLVTEEDAAYMLTVIDAVTMEELQKLRIMDADIEPDSWHPSLRDLHVYDGFIVAVIGDNRFALLTLNAAGDYEVQFEASFDQVEGLEYIFSSQSAMDYSGEKLVVAAFQHGYFQPRNYCSFYLAVYNNAGLAYAGHYQHSLDKSQIPNYNLMCRPVEGVPLRVIWPD